MGRSGCLFPLHGSLLATGRGGRHDIIPSRPRNAWCLLSSAPSRAWSNASSVPRWLPLLLYPAYDPYYVLRASSSSSSSAWPAHPLPASLARTPYPSGRNARLHASVSSASCATPQPVGSTNQPSVVMEDPCELLRLRDTAAALKPVLIHGQTPRSTASSPRSPRATTSSSKPRWIATSRRTPTLSTRCAACRPSPTRIRPWGRSSPAGS